MSQNTESRDKYNTEKLYHENDLCVCVCDSHLDVVVGHENLTGMKANVKLNKEAATFRCYFR